MVGDNVAAETLPSVLDQLIKRHMQLWCDHGHSRVQLRVFIHGKVAKTRKLCRNVSFLELY